MPGTRRACGGECAMGGAGPTAKHRGQARMQRIVDLLRANPMDMGVEAAGCEYLSLARDRLGARTYDDIDAGLRVRVTRLANLLDDTAFQADVCLVDTGVIDDQGVCDNGVDR